MSEYKCYAAVISAMICFVMVGCVFVALFDSGYFYEFQVLLVSSFILLSWLVFLFVLIKRTNIFSNLNLMILVVSVVAGGFLGLFYSAHVWFSGYQNLEPMSNFLLGKTHNDTITHSAIAESFLTNGYPSEQFNSSLWVSYHCLSHLLFAIISKVTGIPCFIVYNFIYPLIFIPLFVFLIQIIVSNLRNFYRAERKICVIDIVLLVFFCMGFNFFDIPNKSCIWNNSMIISESAMVSFTFLLFGFEMFFCLKEKHRWVLCFCVIPLFVFIISGMKISIGVLFFLICAFYVFRRDPLKIKTWGVVAFYFCILILSYKVFSENYSSVVQSGISDIKISDIKEEVFGVRENFSVKTAPSKYFYFLRDNCSSTFWWIHYFILFLPSVVVVCLRKNESLFSKRYFLDRENFIIELPFLLSLGSVLPGIFFNIYGGSAAYFEVPAFMIANIILISLDVFQDFYLCLEKNINKFKNVCVRRFAIALFCLFAACGLLLPEFLKVCRVLGVGNADVGNGPQAMSVGVVDIQSENKNVVGQEAVFSSGVYHFLCMSPFLNDRRYKLISEIRNLVKDNRKSYCVYMDDDCWLYDLYGNDTNLMKCDSAVAALLGIPVVNALYCKDGKKVCRGDGVEVCDFAANRYSLICYPEYTSKEFCSNTAANIGKKYMIVLHKSSYEVIGL